MLFNVLNFSLISGFNKPKFHVFRDGINEGKGTPHEKSFDGTKFVQLGFGLDHDKSELIPNLPKKTGFPRNKL